MNDKPDSAIFLQDLCEPLLETDYLKGGCSRELTAF